MLTAACVFLAQFAYIFLLGFQQLNVVGRNYIAAATTSVFLGVFGFYLVAIVALHADKPMGTLVWWAYVTSGPAGICFAMWIHPKLRS